MQEGIDKDIGWKSLYGRGSWRNSEPCFIRIDIIIQGNPCIKIIEYTKFSFSINNIKKENKTKQNQDVKRGENIVHGKIFHIREAEMLNRWSVKT